MPELKLWAYYWKLYDDKDSDLQNDPELLATPMSEGAKDRRALAEDPNSEMKYESVRERWLNTRDFFFEAQDREHLIRDALEFRRENYAWSRRLLKALAADETGEGLEAFIDLYCLNSYLTSTRKMWLPQGGMGSRAEEMASYQVLVDVMQQRITDRLDWRKERYSESDDD